MSKMLEQAIVDAEALKNAALKNAEEVLLEKYSLELKETIESLLNEQPLGGEEEELDIGGEELVPDIAPDVPLAAAEGEPLCPCPEEKDLHVVDFGALQDEMAQVPHEELAKELPEGPPEEFLEEELNIKEEDLFDILEKLTVDIKPVKSGWAGTPESVIETAEKESLAHEQDDKVSEEKETLRKAVKDLQESIRSMAKQANVYKKETKKYKQIIIEMKRHFDETNIENAKLLYVNRVLSSSSLNERQRNRIVETILKANSIEEAKMIYETLQSTVRSAPFKEGPKSLDEVVNRRSSSLLLSRDKKKAENSEYSMSERMKRLAGIK